MGQAELAYDGIFVRCKSPKVLVLQVHRSMDQAPHARPFAVMVHQSEPSQRSENLLAAFRPIRQIIGVELLRRRTE